MFFLGIFLFSLSISIHELGHAIAMRRYGIELEEVCLLGFGPKIFTFRWRSLFGETPVRIRLIPLGGFVRPSETGSKRIARMPYSKNGHILGGGIVANILFGAILFLAGFIISGGRMTVNDHSGAWILSAIAILFVIGAFPKYSFHLVLPMGLLILFPLINTLVAESADIFAGMPASHSPATAGGVSGPETPHSPVGSFVTVTQQIHQHSTSLDETFIFAGLLSISVGLFNALPFYPLDGGQILLNRVERMFRSRRKKARLLFQIATALPLLILVVWALKGDMFKLVALFR